MIYKYGKDIPSFVRNFREQNKLTQQQLADMVGVHPQYVSNIERGMTSTPLSFCGLMYAIVDKERAHHLTDLLSEASATRVFRKTKARRTKRV
jgi:transcriptional regulator with XRE-family HTH domain